MRGQPALRLDVGCTALGLLPRPGAAVSGAVTYRATHVTEAEQPHQSPVQGQNKKALYSPRILDFAGQS